MNGYLIIKQVGYIVIDVICYGNDCPCHTPYTYLYLWSIYSLTYTWNMYINYINIGHTRHMLNKNVLTSWG